MLLGQHCSMLSTILFGIVTPDCGLIQAEQSCSILLATVEQCCPNNIVTSCFHSLLQLIIFLPCRSDLKKNFCWRLHLREYFVHCCCNPHPANAVESFPNYHFYSDGSTCTRVVWFRFFTARYWFKQYLLLVESYQYTMANDVI